MDSTYQTLNKDDQELFQRHSTSIAKAIREIFQEIPDDFSFQPATIRKVGGCGMFYDFKIPLPDGQFIKVSFHSGGYPLARMPGEKEPEQRFNVDPTPSSSAYE